MSDSKIKYFNQDEINKLFKAISNSDDIYKTRNEAIFKIGYYCALRASEIGLLRLDDINLMRNEIYCRRLKGSLNNTLEILDSDVLRALKRHIRENGPTDILFPSKQFNPISRGMLDVLIKKYCVAANIKDSTKFHFHTLKHSRAVNLAEMGLDLKEIQYYLGHKEISNTLIYFQFTTSQNKEMYRKMRKFER
jgi:site-specific recombinase XerD